MATPSSFETLFLQLVNEARAKAGVGALTFDGELLNASDVHSAWMDRTDTFSHTGASGSSAGERMTAAGYGWQAWGENIAYVSGALTEATVRQLHQNLMNSPGHSANIVRGSFEEIGIGLKQGTINGHEVVFVTENFGTPNAAERAETSDVDGPRIPVPLPVRTVLGTDGNDVMRGTAGWDAMYGGAGNDRYYVRQKGDKAYETAGQGKDKVVSTISYSLGSQHVENLTLSGTADVNGTGNGLKNAITGNSGSNVLEGSGGSDFLNGNGGADLLLGGTGRDAFVFDSAAEANGDTAGDFIRGSDRMNLRQMDADPIRSGDQAFTFLGAQEFHGAPGELRSYHSGPDTYVAGDVDGDGAVDFAIKLMGLHMLASQDFVL